jgi:hypothetical protein
MYLPGTHSHMHQREPDTHDVCLQLWDEYAFRLNTKVSETYTKSGHIYSVLLPMRFTATVHSDQTLQGLHASLLVSTAPHSWLTMYPLADMRS